MFKQFKSVSPVALMAALFMMMVAESAMAGTGGSFMQNLAQFMTDALKGYLGTAIAVAAIVVGLVAGIMRQSLAGFGVGVGVAIAAYYGPDMVSSITTAIL